jgi:hypothetical protein
MAKPGASVTSTSPNTAPKKSFAFDPDGPLRTSTG